MGHTSCFSTCKTTWIPFTFPHRSWNCDWSTRRLSSSTVGATCWAKWSHHQLPVDLHQRRTEPHCDYYSASLCRSITRCSWKFWLLHCGGIILLCYNIMMGWCSVDGSENAFPSHNYQSFLIYSFRQKSCQQLSMWACRQDLLALTCSATNTCYQHYLMGKSIHRLRLNECKSVDSINVK